MRRREHAMVMRWTFWVIAGALAASAVGAEARPPSRAPSCFYPSDWSGGWKATPDSKTIYLRVRAHDIYRLDLGSACPDLQAPDAHLILNAQGTDVFCTALDFDLGVAEVPPTIAASCIVRRVTELTPAEAAALPKSLRP